MEERGIDSNSVAQLGALTTFLDEMQVLMVIFPSLLAVISIKGRQISGQGGPGASQPVPQPRH